MLALGVPIERVALSISTLHAEHDAVGRIWLKDGGVKESVYVSPGPDDPTFLRSPYYAALTSREWVEMRLAETPDDRFGIVPDLKAEGYTHYICAPITFANEMTAWVTLATRAPDGFSARALAIIASILPPFSVLLELRVAWGTLRNVLRIYVGDEPRQAILRGNVKRGQVSTIRSAILFADMRDSTQQTVELGAVGAVELFNNFFDCLVPAIEQRHGEVLKYLGDGLLAIFREAKDGDCDAPERALFAARDSLASLNAFNTEHPDRPQMRAGIALHYGEAAYGNIGSGARLDFTVIGRDVSLASRIADVKSHARRAAPHVCGLRPRAWPEGAAAREVSRQGLCRSGRNLPPRCDRCDARQGLPNAKDDILRHWMSGARRARLLWRLAPAFLPRNRQRVPIALDTAVRIGCSLSKNSSPFD